MPGLSLDRIKGFSAYMISRSAALPTTLCLDKTRPQITYTRASRASVRGTGEDSQSLEPAKRRSRRAPPPNSLGTRYSGGRLAGRYAILRHQMPRERCYTRCARDSPAQNQNRVAPGTRMQLASRPKVVDGAAPNHVSLRRAHERYLGCDHATYPYDGNATYTFQNRIQGHKRTISQLRAHLIKARVTILHYNVLTKDNC